MGNVSFCSHDRETKYNQSMSPVLYKRRLKDKPNLDIINPVCYLELKTVNKECLECVHYSNSQQRCEDRPSLSTPQYSNDVKFLGPFEEVETGITSPIPDALRQEDELDDLACLKPPSAVIAESKKTLYSGNNIKQSSPQFQYSYKPKDNMDIRTSPIPDEVVNVISRWMKSEKMSLKSLTEMLESDALLLSESRTTGDDMPIKRCRSNVETQRLPGSMRRNQYDTCIPSSINIDGNDITSADSSIISEPDRRMLTPDSEKWYTSGTELEGGESTSEEQTQFYDEDCLAFSKIQLEHSRRKSVLVSEIVAKLPPLSHVFSEMSRGSVSVFNENLFPSRLAVDANGNEIPVELASGNKSETENISIIADIDMLERSIDEKTAKIKELRRQSVDILTTGYESDLTYDSDEDVDMSTYLKLEKEVKQLKNEKSNLQKKKDAFVSHLRCQTLQSLTCGGSDLLSINEEVPPYDELELTNSSVPSVYELSRLSVPDTLQRRSFSYSR